MTILEQVEIELINPQQQIKTVYIDIADNSLSRKWLQALNHLLANNYHLEKNYCFFGFADSARSGEYILNQVNASIQAINQANLGYHINDHFNMQNCITNQELDGRCMGRNLVHDRLNWLHRYFEDLQGVSGNISPYYQRASAETRWHIRQLNLLCHEFESWALSYRKQIEAPEWCRPSQLMCWLNAPRFVLDEEDYELFGIDTINRPMGGVFVGVNKAVGKHHWEVFNDEGRDSRIDELTTTTLKSQTEAAGDFDIEWGRNPAEFDFQKRKLEEFRCWLVDNGFDPNDCRLTIGHPQIGQVDLQRTFGTKDHLTVWNILNNYLNVHSVKTSTHQAVYTYNWSDADYMSQQVAVIQQG